MKKFTVQIIFLLLVIIGSLVFATGKAPVLPFLPQETKSAQVSIKNSQLKVEVADSDTKRTKGLGGRETLAANSGMLFIFPKPDKYAFWMKGLKFPLDFIWISNNIVADITKNAKVPTSGQADDTLPIYVPRQEVDMVLEVNAGYVDNHSINIGDRVDVQRP